MWNELGGAGLATYELEGILKHSITPKLKRILQNSNSGPTLAKQTDIDIKRVCDNILKRTRPSPKYDREYTPEQGRIEAKRKDSRDYIIKDVNRVYTIFKKREITHRGRKPVKDNLILVLLLLLSYSKYPEIHPGIIRSLKAKERAAFMETLEYVLDRFDPEYMQHRIEEEIKYAYDRESYFASLREDYLEKKDIYLLKNIETIPQRQIEIINKVVYTWEKKEGKIPFNGRIFIAALIYAHREWERKTGIKILKQNTELSKIWGIPQPTLDRYLGYLRKLERDYPEPAPVSYCSPISMFTPWDTEK